MYELFVDVMQLHGEVFFIINQLFQLIHFVLQLFHFDVLHGDVLRQAIPLGLEVLETLVPEKDFFAFMKFADFRIGKIVPVLLN